MKKNPPKLARICQECDNYYIPAGKFSKLCDYCRGRRYERGLKTRRENKIKLKQMKGGVVKNEKIQS